jgi:hypothetical protein
MSRWVRSGSGTYYRLVARSKKDRRCDDCRRLLPAGGPYTEHRATMWCEFVSSPYSIRTCGPTTADCREGVR